ncbi:hypothetical protein T484DRAFT_1830716, partial [Baffinella frigidus]
MPVSATKRESKCVWFICTNFTDLADICCATLELCGNGILQECEVCDDGNLMDDDGCSSVCTIDAFFYCQDGCTGPKCETRDGCTSQRLLPTKQETSQDIFSWLNIDGIFSSKGDIDIQVLNNAIQSGYMGGVNSGILLELANAEFAVSAVNMYTSAYTRNTGERKTKDMAFKSLVSRIAPVAGTSYSGLACSFCGLDGETRLDWINGSISALAGPLINDETCTIFLSAGKPPVPGQDEGDGLDLSRAVVLQLRGLELRTANEYIIIFNSGGIIANLSFADNGLTRQYEAIAPVQIRYQFRSLRTDGRGWDPSDAGKLRMDIDYATLLLSAKTVECILGCGYASACIGEMKCLWIGSTYIYPEDVR